ncbi:kinesin-like protein KIF19 [Pelodytes ibericus]
MLGTVNEAGGSAEDVGAVNEAVGSAEDVGAVNEAGGSAEDVGAVNEAVGSAEDVGAVNEAVGSAEHAGAVNEAVGSAEHAGAVNEAVGSAEDVGAVALRVRPINEAELEDEATVIAHKLGEQMAVLMDPTEGHDNFLRCNRTREKTFIFDVVFDTQATQEEVYKSTTKNMIEGVLSGYNATVFAYGPTGTGKTYTMLGMDCEPGIYILTLNDLFKAIEETRDTMEYAVSMCYLEIYNEVIRDLLNPSSGVLELREDSKGDIQIAGITEVSTNNANEIMELLRRGNKLRTQEPTAANKTSSRSHAVLQVIVKQKSKVKDIHQEVRVGKLFMIDLAGSERASQTQNRGKRMTEGAHINRSLLALGNCIMALSERGGSRNNHHINFRDSKLTRLLKDSLGGNSRTVMIAHISPASTSFEESRTTLIYAYRAKNIKTRVKRNLQNVSYQIAQYTSIIADLHKEIAHLKETVRQQDEERKANRQNIMNLQGILEHVALFSVLDSSPFRSQEMTNLRDQLIGAFKEQMEMRRSLMQLENINIELHIDTSRHLVTIAEWEQDKAQRASKLQQKHGDKLAEDTPAGNETEVESPEPHEVRVAREEINMLLAEQRKTATLKADLEKRLAETQRKASQLEQMLPKQITSEDQQEVLKLLCRVHELEVRNTELQAKDLGKENLLCQKHSVILHYQQRRSLCDEIIQHQQEVIEDNKLHIPDYLKKLYQVYAMEQEEGALNRFHQLHSVLCSTLKNDVAVNCNGLQKFGNPPFKHLNLEQLQKAVSESRKGVLSRPRLELPPIVFESDSETTTSKSTPAFLHTRQNSSLSPTAFLPGTTPGPQMLLDDPPSKELNQNLTSPSYLGYDWRSSVSVPHRRPNVEEIAAGTKSISLVAARRRSRVLFPEFSFFKENGKTLTLLHPTGPEDGQSVTAQGSNIKKAISMESLPAETQVPKTKPQSLNTNSISHPKARHIVFKSKTLPRPRITKSLTTSTLTIPASQEAGPCPLQTLEVSRTPPSTNPKSSAVRSKVQILHKRVRGQCLNLIHFTLDSKIEGTTQYTPNIGAKLGMIPPGNNRRLFPGNTPNYERNCVKKKRATHR